MRVLCAWCDKTIRTTCSHCNRELREGPAGHMVCDGDPINQESPLLFTKAATLRMQISHGICHECAALTDEDRANLIAQKRGPTGVPRAPTLAPNIERKSDGTA